MMDSDDNKPVQPSAPPPQPPPPQQPSFSITRYLPTVLMIAALMVIVLVGYILVDAVLTMTRPITSAPGAVGTQVQQIFNPTPTIIADPRTVILQVQSLSRLETASYTIEKIITAESGEGALGFLFSDRLLLVAHGEVIAGVDLSRMTENDVTVAGNSAFVTLPAAEVFVATLDNDATYVYDRQTAVLGQQVDLETLARQEAETRILEAALEDGILDMAQRNAELYITGLIRALGFDEVVFVTGTPSPDQNRGD